MPLPRCSSILFASVVTLGLCGQVRAQIPSEAVNEAVANLSSGDREKVMAGRVSLVNLLNAGRSNPPVLTSFTGDIGGKLMPIVSGNDPHAKLNAAIFIQRAADQTGNPALAEVITKLISDRSAAVAEYGLRSAANVLPRLYADPKLNAGPLEAAIVQSVIDHPESEAVAAESYASVLRILTDRDAANLLGAPVVAAATPKSIDAIHKLLTARIGEYGSGDIAEPAAEQPAVAFLGRQSTWTAASATQRAQSVSLLLQLMTGAATELSEVPAGQNSRLKLEALRNLVKSSAGALSVISDLEGKGDLKAAAQKVNQLGLATPVAEYRQAITQLATDFQKGMPNVKLPATGPSTAPTTAQ